MQINIQNYSNSEELEWSEIISVIKHLSLKKMFLELLRKAIDKKNNTQYFK